MDYTRTIIDEVLSNTVSAIDDFEHDREKYSLFEITQDEDSSFPNIIFDDRIILFFELLIGSENLGDSFISRKVENSLYEKQDYDAFLYYFLSDIKMYLLKDALINLVDYFSIKNSRLKHKDIVNELFYGFDAFEKHVKEYMSNIKHSEMDEVDSAVQMNLDAIEFNVPKISFTWYAYALSHTYKYLPKLKSRKRLNIINRKYLSLKWTRSEYPNEVEIFRKAQGNFKNFIESLIQEGNLSNRSLNLYLFNEITNLYDINNIISLFKDSPYMEYQRIRIENEIKTLEDANDNERYHRKKRILEGASHIAKINALGVKTLLIDDHYSEELFTNEKVWGTFNRIFNHCKDIFSDLLNKECQSEYEYVDSKIRLDYCVYKRLHNDEPYENLIDEFLEEGIPIYVPYECEENTHLYEAYSYAYKAFYNSRYGVKN